MLESYQVVGIVILGVLAATVGALVIAHVIGPSRRGPQKDSAYESGMPIIHDIHRRFNIRFYIIAMLFILFDVDLVLIWPWTGVYYEACTVGPVEVAGSGLLAGAVGPGSVVAGKGYLLAGMGLFFVILILGLIYEWRKGAFEWD